MQSMGIDEITDYDKVMPTTFGSNSASIPGQGGDAASNDIKDPPNAAALRNALQYKISTFKNIFDTAGSTAIANGVCPNQGGATSPIQNAISSGQPVVVSFPVTPEYDAYDGARWTCPRRPTLARAAGATSTSAASTTPMACGA